MISTFAIRARMLIATHAGAAMVEVTEQSPTDVKLAFIDTGQMTLPASFVKRYTTLLDTLNGRCTEDRTLIADMAVRATELIKKDSGQVVKVRTILEQMVAATRGSHPQGRSFVYATLALTIKHGQ